MIELRSVLECVRGMDYKGVNIHYVTGVCNEVRLSMDDCIEVLRRYDNGRIGYINDSYDMLDVLGKSGAISKAVYETFQEHKIVYELEDHYINIDSMITVCEFYKINDFKKFLVKAKKQINEFGSYIDHTTFVSLDKRNCNDRNLSNSLYLDVVSRYADINNMVSEDVYVEICDIVAGIVFGCTMEEIRSRYGLYYEDYLCDSISQFEFDKITFICSAITYLLKYSDLSLRGVEILADMASRAFTTNYQPKEYNYKNFRRNNKSEDVDPYLAPLKNKKESEELEDFKRYM